MNTSNTSDSSTHASPDTVPMFNHTAQSAEDLMQRGTDALRHTGEQLQERAHSIKETAGNYIRNEPVKSVLIAAATGAVLMGVLGLISRVHLSR